MQNTIETQYLHFMTIGRKSLMSVPCQTPRTPAVALPAS